MDKGEKRGEEKRRASRGGKREWVKGKMEKARAKWFKGGGKGKGVKKGGCKGQNGVKG